MTGQTQFERICVRDTCPVHKSDQIKIVSKTRVMLEYDTCHMHAYKSKIRRCQSSHNMELAREFDEGILALLVESDAEVVQQQAERLETLQTFVFVAAESVAAPTVMEPDDTLRDVVSGAARAVARWLEVASVKPAAAVRWRVLEARLRACSKRRHEVVRVLQLFAQEVPALV